MIPVCKAYLWKMLEQSDPLIFKRFTGDLDRDKISTSPFMCFQGKHNGTCFSRTEIREMGVESRILCCSTCTENYKIERMQTV